MTIEHSIDWILENVVFLLWYRADHTNARLRRMTLFLLGIPWTFVLLFAVGPLLIVLIMLDMTRTFWEGRS